MEVRWYQSSFLMLEEVSRSHLLLLPHDPWFCYWGWVEHISQPFVHSCVERRTNKMALGWCIK